MKVTDINKRIPKLDNRPHQNRSSIDTDADLYENNRNENLMKKQPPIHVQQQHHQQKSRQNSPISAKSNSPLKKAEMPNRALSNYLKSV